MTETLWKIQQQKKKRKRVRELMIHWLLCQYFTTKSVTIQCCRPAVQASEWIYQRNIFNHKMVIMSGGYSAEISSLFPLIHLFIWEEIYVIYQRISWHIRIWTQQNASTGFQISKIIWKMRKTLSSNEILQHYSQTIIPMFRIMRTRDNVFPKVDKIGVKHFIFL